VASLENKKALAEAAATKDPAQRSLQIAAVIAETLREIGQDPVLVGGAAVEFYTRGGYSTADIDMLAEGGSELQAAMKRLGFERLGKDYVQEKLRIYVEFPGRELQASESAIVLKVGTRKLRIISIEDLIVDRLAAFKFWQSAIDGLNAIMLLEMGEEDAGRVERRARESLVEDALFAVRMVREQSIRRKLSNADANCLLEEEMKKLKSLRR